FADRVVRVPSSEVDNLSSALRNDGPPPADVTKTPLRTILGFLYSPCTFMPSFAAYVPGRVQQIIAPEAATRLEEEKVQECRTAKLGRKIKTNALMSSAADMRIARDPVVRVPGRAT
ncbi:hypothetical protein FS837_008540, partial [Tulasnella sp. UAMH 9824]